MNVISRKDAKVKNLKRYFTGKPCKRGHIDERIVSTGNCNTCKVLRTRDKRASGYREIENARYRERYATDPEFRKKELRMSAEYTANNRARRTAYEARRKSRVRAEMESYQLQQSIESALGESLHLQQDQVSSKSL